MADEAKFDPFPNYPDKEQVAEFYAALGMAVARWQLVETNLSDVYRGAIGPKSPGALAASFHAMQTFNMKLGAVDMAVKFVTTTRSTLRDEWAKIRDAADEKSTGRNHFVHFSVFTYYNEPKRQDRIRIQPQVYDTRYAAGLKPNVEYRLNEVAAISETFVKLAERLRQFAGKLDGHLAPPEESPKPPPDSDPA